MNKNNTPELQADDFVLALQELGTYIDVSVDDLLQLHRTAEKYARLRKRESVLIESLMTKQVKTVHPDSTLSEAAHLLVTEKISGLPVVDDNNILVGVITEADFLRALGVPSHHPGQSVWQTLENLFSHSGQIREPEGRVADLMMSQVITVLPTHTLHHALEVMKQNQIKRLIVCDESMRVVGMITRSDLVRVFFDHFKHDSKKA